MKRDEIQGTSGGSVLGSTYGSFMETGRQAGYVLIIGRFGAGSTQMLLIALIFSVRKFLNERENVERGTRV